MKTGFVANLLVISLIAAPLPALSQPGEVANGIQSLLGNAELSIRGMDILTHSVISEAYEGHEYGPFWTDPRDIEELLALLQSAGEHGLIPGDYGVEILATWTADKPWDGSAGQQSEFDVLMTEALVRYGYHRRFAK